MKNCYSTLLLLFPLIAFAQSDLDPKSLYNDGNYSAALEGFEAQLKSDPDDSQLYHLAGECILKINGDRSKAITYLKKAVDSGKYQKIVLFLLAEAYAQNYEFDLAIDYYNHFLKTVSKKLSADVKKRIIDCQTAKELMKFPVDVTYTHLGEDVNSEHPDYNPFVGADEEYLLFTSRRNHSGSQKEFDGFYPADVYESKLMEDGFGNADMLNKNVNSKFDDLLVGLSHDANKLVIYYDDVDFYGDLFTSERTGRTFSRKEPMDLVNTLNDLESSATFSPDGNAIVFASDRPESIGMTDLFIVRKLPDGT